MDILKSAEYNPFTSKDRVSSIISFFTWCAFVHAVLNGFSNNLAPYVMIGGYIVDYGWCKYYLPKRPNAPIVSKNEYIASWLLTPIMLVVFVLRIFFPEIIPECKNIILGCVLFAGLAYFALSTPTPRGTW